MHWELALRAGFLKTDSARKLIQLLKRHEGRAGRLVGGAFRHFPYDCPAGKRTIGYGRNLEDVGISEVEELALGLPEDWRNQGIGEVEAEILLCADIAKAYNQAWSAYDWFEGLDDVRKAVVVSMIFNLGFRGWLGFRNTIGALRRGAFAEASRHMRKSKWATQVGKRSRELALMMRTGQWLKEEGGSVALGAGDQ